METKEITCIECPNGCLITAKIDNGQIINIDGFTCPRGKQYAENECICPRRVLTTTVKTSDGRVLAVKTEKPIQKAHIFDILKKINTIVVNKPVKIGEIISKNIDEDINLIAINNLENL